MAYVKSKSIKKTVKRAIDYIIDENKLGKEMQIVSFGVSTDLADVEFSMIRDEYNRKSLKSQSPNENLALHIVQSHAPTDKVTAKEALEIAVKTAQDFTGNDYAYVIAIHTDTDKIHAHIIVNAYSHTGKNKFYKKDAIHDLLEISNKHCLAYGLTTSQINRNVKPSKIYSKTNEYVNKPSNREKLKYLIDELVKRSSSFDEFLEDVQTIGIEIKYRGGLSFLLPNAKQVIRLSSLQDENYDTVAILKQRIAIESTTGAVNTLNELRSVLRAEKMLEIPTMPKISQGRKWVNYYARDYWKRKSDNLANISFIAKMLSHLRAFNITSVSDYIKLIDGKLAHIESIKKQTTKFEREYDNIVSLYKDSPSSLRFEKRELETEMIEIRTKIKVLNNQYREFQNELIDLQKFREIFESSVQKKLKEKELKL